VAVVIIDELIVPHAQQPENIAGGTIFHEFCLHVEVQGLDDARLKVAIDLKHCFAPMSVHEVDGLAVVTNSYHEEPIVYLKDEMHILALDHEQLPLDSFPILLLNNKLFFPIGKDNLLEVDRNFDDQLVGHLLFEIHDSEIWVKLIELAKIREEVKYDNLFVSFAETCEEALLPLALGLEIKIIYLAVN
jgi:hypothetical protein